MVLHLREPDSYISRLHIYPILHIVGLQSRQNTPSGMYSQPQIPKIKAEKAQKYGVFPAEYVCSVGGAKRFTDK